MPARPVALNADGSATIRAGRFYRALLVVNGEPGEAELYDAVEALGFSRKESGAQLARRVGREQAQDVAGRGAADARGQRISRPGLGLL